MEQVAAIYVAIGRKTGGYAHRSIGGTEWDVHRAIGPLARQECTIGRRAVLRCTVLLLLLPKLQQYQLPAWLIYLVVWPIYICLRSPKSPQGHTQVPQEHRQVYVTNLSWETGWQTLKVKLGARHRVYGRYLACRLKSP